MSEGVGAVLSDAEYTNSKLREMAKLLDIDTDLWVFKRFQKLNLYNLLHLQHHLTQLESELSHRLDCSLSIDELIPAIRRALYEYSKPPPLYKQ
jgi:hypothetical protein